MPADSGVVPQSAPMPRRRFLTVDNRFLPPLLITAILVTAHLSFGILESYQRTALAIATAIGAELIMGRLTYGGGADPARAHIPRISGGRPVGPPFFLPEFPFPLFFLPSQYGLRFRDRPPSNPSTFSFGA